jgi:CRP/FNR family transcriptional regulator, dissimilatory nitrate respiration regulator
MIDVALLEGIEQFRSLNQAAKLALAARAIERHYPSETTIFSAGDQALGIFIVIEGRVRVVRETGSRRHVIHEEGPGGTLGEVPMFEDGGYPATAIAAEPTRCIVIGKDAIAAAMSLEPALAWLLLRRLAMRVRTLVDRLDRATSHSIPKRLAAHLVLRMERSGGSRITLGGTQQSIAEELGTVREVIVRTLRSFVADGLLRSLGGGRYEVRDEVRLRAAADSGSRTAPF